MAPPLIRRERENWIREQVESLEIEALLVESPQGERELVRADFQGEIIRYNEHNQIDDAKKLAEDMRNYKNGGLLSDGGTPCVGDPGSELVRELHQKSIPVRCVGIHSYVLASIVMSGCDGNNFHFQGYPPKDDREFHEWLTRQSSSETICFIETPYRMKKRLFTSIDFLKQKKSAWVSFSENIGTKEERTIAGSPKQWMNQNWVEKLPAKPVGIIVFRF